MKIVLIRHFQTPGNLLGNYIGVTDEDLLPSIRLPAHIVYPKAERIYSSPLKRCIQTAKLIYPGQSILVKESLKECDFGTFEGKNYQQLCRESCYQEWLNRKGTIPFPNGEDPMKFRERCCKGFTECIAEAIHLGMKSVAFVVHGGTIMSIMEAFDSERKEFYDHQVKNGTGFVLTLEEEQWKQGNYRMKSVRI